MKKNNFIINLTPQYRNQIKKITKKNSRLVAKVVATLKKLRMDPLGLGLRTHIVNTSSIGKVYSSRVNGDIRILWRFENGDIILLLTIGGYSGSTKVCR